MEARSEIGGRSRAHDLAAALRTHAAKVGRELRRLAIRSARLSVLLDALAVGVVLRVAYVLSVRLTRSGVSYDESWFVWSGWSFLKGWTPYKDFHAFKPPFIYLTNAAAIKLFGLDGSRYRYLFQAMAVGSLATLLVAMLRRGVDRVLGACLVILVAQLYFEPHFHDSSLNDAESIGLAYYLFGVAFLLWPARRRSISRALGGGCLAACVLSKEPFALCVAPTWLVFAFDDDRKLDRASVVLYAKHTLAGVAVVVGGTLLHLITSGGLPYYLRMMKEYAPFARTYCVTLGRFVPSSFSEDQRQNWTYLNGAFVNVTHLGAFFPFFAAAFVTITRKRLLHVVTAALAFAGACYATTIGHCFWVHYFVMAFAGTALLAVVGAIGLSQSLGRSRSPLRWWAGIVIATSVYLLVSPRYDLEKAGVYAVPKYGGVAADLVEFISANSAKGDYVLTIGPPAVYVYADRRTLTGPNAFLDELLGLLPGTTDEERLAPLRAELARTMPALVILDQQWQSRARRFLDKAILPFLAEKKYREVRSTVWARP